VVSMACCQTTSAASIRWTRSDGELAGCSAAIAGEERIRKTSRLRMKFMGSNLRYNRLQFAEILEESVTPPVGGNSTRRKLYATRWNPWTLVETLDKKTGQRVKKALIAALLIDQLREELQFESTKCLGNPGRFSPQKRGLDSPARTRKSGSRSCGRRSRTTAFPGTSACSTDRSRFREALFLSMLRYLLPKAAGGDQTDTLCVETGSSNSLREAA